MRCQKEQIGRVQNQILLTQSDVYPISPNPFLFGMQSEFSLLPIKQSETAAKEDYLCVFFILQGFRPFFPPAILI